MDLQQGAWLATIIGAMFTTIMSVATVVILYLTLKLNQRILQLTWESKQADVFGEYNARFSRIWEMRANPNVISNPLVFYERFWSLQFDQFSSWRQGFVPEDNFRYWIERRYDDWVEDKPLGSMNYRDGFHQVVANWRAREFQDFMNAIHTSGVDHAFQTVKSRRQQGERR
jgi:hypothetical protein